MTAFNDAKAVIGLSSLFNEVHQLGQIWLSDSAIVAAHIEAPMSASYGGCQSYPAGKTYPLRYGGGATSTLVGRRNAQISQERRFKVESGVLANSRRNHCTEVDTPFDGMRSLRLSLDRGCVWWLSIECNRWRLDCRNVRRRSQICRDLLTFLCTARLLSRSVGSISYLATDRHSCCKPLPHDYRHNDSSDRGCRESDGRTDRYAPGQCGNAVGNEPGQV